MSHAQTAQVQNYDFGAPAVLTEVLRFRASRGGIMHLRFEATNSENDLVVSVQVSPDGVTTAATTSTNNTSAVTGMTVKKGLENQAIVALRQGVDNFVHVLASGPGRGQLQIRTNTGDNLLQVEKE